MAQIQQLTLRPQEFREHRHMHLIEAIVEEVLTAGQPLHIYKVKSHTGIIGNEIADELAVQVAKTTIEDSPPEWRDCTPPSNNRGNMYWPNTLTTNSADPLAAPIPKPMPNMADYLKQNIHHLSKLGKSNTRSLYFRAWQSISSITSHKHSHHFLSSTTYPPAVKSCILKCRTGTLYTQNNAFKFGKATNPNCLLCGQPDGIHHSLSSCPTVKDAIQARHNRAGRIILEAIAEGRQGTSLIQADVGSTKTTYQAAGKTLDRKLPTDWITNTAPPEAHSRPDITLHTKGKIHIVEIKYCRDTDPQGQCTRAQAQHTHLTNHLKTTKPDHTIEHHTILLGVQGTIYTTHTVEPLKNMGVLDGHLQDTLLKLHKESTTSAHTLIMLKRHLERNRPAPQNRTTVQSSGVT
jgi:hypothetical protein